MSDTETTQPERLSVTEAMAKQYGMTAKNFEQTLRATVVPKETTREEFAAFLIVARQYGLNPILREIYAFPKKGGGIQPIVGVDGWANLINSHPQADGMEFCDHIDERGELLAITCQMHRKDRAHPITATEYLVECRRNTDPWRQWPRRMLRHKAMIQAARYAFGFSGIIEPDEYDRFGKTPHGPEAFKTITQAPAFEAYYQAQAAMTEPNDGGPAEEATASPGGHDLYVQARYHASRGTDAFKAWLEERSKHDRLIVSQIEEKLTAIAAQADAEQGEQPLDL